MYMRARPICDGDDPPFIVFHGARKLTTSRTTRTSWGNVKSWSGIPKRSERLASGSTIKGGIDWLSEGLCWSGGRVYGVALLSLLPSSLPGSCVTIEGKEGGEGGTGGREGEKGGREGFDVGTFVSAIQVQVQETCGGEGEENQHLNIIAHACHSHSLLPSSLLPSLHSSTATQLLYRQTIS
jgi:hypothetical protein